MIRHSTETPKTATRSTRGPAAARTPERQNADTIDDIQFWRRSLGKAPVQSLSSEPRVKNKQQKNHASLICIRPVEKLEDAS